MRAHPGYVCPEFRAAIGRTPRTQEDRDALRAVLRSDEFESWSVSDRAMAIARWLDAVDQTSGHHGFIYAAYANGAVKIGFSKNPVKRVQQLRTGVPDLRLVGVAWGTRIDEQMTHRLLRAYCVGGEWFDNNAPEVRAFVLRFLSEV